MKSIFQKRCSYGNIPIYTLIGIYWICQIRRLLVVESRRWWPGVLICSFPAKFSVPSKEMNTLFQCHTVLQCFLAVPRCFSIVTLAFTCSTMEERNTREWQAETWDLLLTLAQQPKTRAFVTNGSKCSKKAAKTPVGIFIAIKVFTCLFNLSRTGIQHTNLTLFWMKWG